MENMIDVSRFLMKKYVRMFLSSSNYTVRHAAVIGMSRVPDKENTVIHLSWLEIARFYVAMQIFGFRHGLRSPHCSCLDS